MAKLIRRILTVGGNFKMPRDKKPEEIVLMPIPGSRSKEFLFCVKMYCEM